MTRECTEETFLKDVQQHEMTIIRDNGVHRHVRFSKPGTGCMHFDLLTWPGYLCYTGDMGTYVFRRLHDMFEFFRTKPERVKGIFINEDYWASKLEATDKDSNHRVYSPARFREFVIDKCKEWRHEMTRAEFREFREAIDDDVLRFSDYGRDEVANRLNDFEHAGRRWFDVWESNFEDYTFRFLWCCYALSWGIQKYDAERAKLEAASKRNGDEWPGGLVWTIGGVKFVELDDALRAVRQVQS